MTFATATLNNSQTAIASIQSEIEALQQRLSELQHHHQQLLSAEQKGESALQQFREAVATMASLGEADMLASFISQMSAVVSEFDTVPAGHLPEVIDVEPEPATPEPDPEPTPPTPPAPSDKTETAGTPTPQPASVGSAALDWTDIETLATSLTMEEIKAKAASLGVSKPIGHHRSKAAWLKAIKAVLS